MVNRFVGEEPRFVGLDLEAMYWEAEGMLPWTRLPFCASWGEAGQVEHIEAVDMRPGKFHTDDLLEVRNALVTPGTVVVCHNVDYDLPLLNGLLTSHGLEPLPPLMVVDTIGTNKWGRAYRRTLKDQCKLYDVRLKLGSPDWRAVIQGEPAAWVEMLEYCDNDVECALALRLAHIEAGIPDPVRMWYPDGRR